MSTENNKIQEKSNGFSENDKKRICYQAFTNAYLTTRIGITNILLTLAVALLVLIPKHYSNAPTYLFMLCVGLFASVLLCGLLIHEIDSWHLKYLKEKAEGKESNPYGGLSSFLQYTIYALFCGGVFCLVTMIFMLKTGANNG